MNYEWEKCVICGDGKEAYEEFRKKFDEAAVKAGYKLVSE